MIQLVEVDLFEIGFQYFSSLISLMDVMLVWRVARPVAARSVDLYYDEMVTRESWRYDVVNLPCRIIPAANLDLDIQGCNELGLVILIGWRLGKGILAIAFCIDGKRCMSGQPLFSITTTFIPLYFIYVFCLL